MSLGSFHDVPRAAFSYLWDHSIDPAIEIEDGRDGLVTRPGRVQ